MNDEHQELAWKDAKRSVLIEGCDLVPAAKSFSGLDIQTLDTMLPWVWCEGGDDEPYEMKANIVRIGNALIMHPDIYDLLRSNPRLNGENHD